MPAIIANGKTRMPEHHSGAKPAGVAVVASGDMTSADRVRQFAIACRSVLAAGRGREVAVDLTGVTAADTKLIAVLIEVHEWSRDQGKRLRIRFCSVVRTWLAICRADEVLGLGEKTCKSVADLDARRRVH